MKILLIGNKTDIPDKTKEIEELAPDMVVRVNKCNSWEKTKTPKTDIWLMDICTENHYDEFKKIPKECLNTIDYKFFFIENSQNVSLYTIFDFTKLKKLNIVSYEYSIPIKKYLPKYNPFNYRPSNFVWMLIYCLEKINKPKLDDKVNLYVTACDIEDRSYLGDNKFHKDVYHDEEKLLQKLVKEGKIHVI